MTTSTAAQEGLRDATHGVATLKAEIDPAAVTSAQGDTFKPVVVKVLIGKPLLVTAPPVHGKRVVISFTVIRSDTGSKLTHATMVGDLRIGTKAIGHGEQFKDGIATIRFTVPATAKGKLVEVQLTIGYEGRSTTRVSTFHIS